LATQFAGFNRPGGWLCCELNDVVKLGPFDLRQADNAQDLETFLTDVSLETLLAAMQEQPSLKAGGGMVA
jgi:hypothetical protein